MGATSNPTTLVVVAGAGAAALYEKRFVAPCGASAHRD